MSVGRFQLALRALGARFAGCALPPRTPPPYGLRRQGHFVAPNPALREGGAGGGEGRAKKKKPQTHVHLPDRASKKYLPTFFSFFFFFQKSFYCVFACFSAWGTQKQRKNFFGKFLVMTQKPPHDPKKYFF